MSLAPSVPQLQPILAISNETLFEKYGRLCGAMAWEFVRRHNATLGWDELDREDANDYCAAAFLRLMQCPLAHRHEPPYVKRLIVNTVIREWRKSLRRLTYEKRGGMDSAKIANSAGKNATFVEFSSGNFRSDFLENPLEDPIARRATELTDATIDYRRLLVLLPELPSDQQIVLKLHFGIGCPACSIRKIARKLGKSEMWASRRLDLGLLKLREMLDGNGSGTTRGLSTAVAANA